MRKSLVKRKESMKQGEKRTTFFPSVGKGKKKVEREGEVVGRLRLYFLSSARGRKGVMRKRREKKRKK